MGENEDARPERRITSKRAQRAMTMAGNALSEPCGAAAVDQDVEGAIESCCTSPEELRALVLAHRRHARNLLDAELQMALAARGVDPRDVCERELTARVADLSVCELLQMINMGRKDATIELFHGPLVSCIWCTAGEIVDATSGRLAGVPAVHRILAVEQGEILADFRPNRRRRTITDSTQSLMLDALLRKDECAVLEKRLGGIQSAYRFVVESRGTVEPGSPEAAVLARFGVGASVEAVLVSGEHDDLSTLRAITRLVERGALIATELSPEVSLPRGAVQVVPASFPTTLPGPGRRHRAPWRTVGAAAGVSGVLALLGLLFARNGAGVRVDATGAGQAPGVASLALTARPARALPPGSFNADRDSSQPSEDGLLASAYSVQVVVEPRTAELWLDGKWMATGALSIRLEETGLTHELRIAAPAHQQHTVLFRDTSPPLAVHLLPAVNAGASEPLPN
jgi:hypothetical protein